MHAAYVVVIFSAVSRFLFVGALPEPQLNFGKSAMNVLQKTSQNLTAAAMDISHNPSMSDSGAIYISKPSSTQKQQEKLTRALNGTISALSSKTSDQTRQLELKLTSVTQNIDDLKRVFNASIAEWNSFITKLREDFNAKLESMNATSKHQIELLERNIASKLEAYHNATTISNDNSNNGLKLMSGGYQGARLILF